MEEKIQQPEQSLEPPKTSRYSPSQIAIFLGGIIFLLALAGATFTAFKSSSKNQNTTNTQVDQTKALNLAPYSFVYGVWTTNNSLIKSFDLESGKTYDLASLPTHIKKVTVLDNDRLLYIGDTDPGDHGKNLSIHTISKNSDAVIIKAADGFGIDDYVVSPNKQYVALWEVQVDPSTGVLSGGQSRVYTANLKTPDTMHLIYSEGTVAPVHYPRGILDNGTLYSDTFLANSAVGWAYGMGISSFDGSQKKDLATMQNGTYGTQPELSPDGKYFVFAGYDGTKGDGATEVNGLRQAIVFSDTLELLDTNTNQRMLLPGISNQNIYVRAQWDNTGKNIIYTQIDTKKDSQTYSYNIQTHTATLIPTTGNTSVVTGLTDNQYVLGKVENTTLVGNLGRNYAYIISDPNIFDISNNQTSSLTLVDNSIQYITLQPAAYFSANAPLASDSPGNNQLQLQAYVTKPSLAPVRNVQQSVYVAPAPSKDSSSDSTTPTPTVKRTQSCTVSGPGIGTITGGTPCPTHTETVSCGNPQSAPQCANLPKCSDLAAQRGVPLSQVDEGVECYDSPLYLYGPKGMEVSVTINTPVFNAVPSYSSSYNATLLGNGNFEIQEKAYNMISYDYIPAKTVPPPTKGVISSQENVKQTLQSLAQKIGLNTKETTDLIDFANEKIDSPYVFISFYNHDTSKQILPLSFNPQPDTYRNIVFYFKKLEQKPKQIPQPPTFEKIQRHGFTAIEISEIVE